ncbi:MAG: ribbon-helix-helix protein, CopG family [Thermoproteota archaeon]
MSSKESLKQISFKCEDSLFLKLEEEVKKTNTTKAAIIREALAKLLQHDIDEIRELSRGTPPYSGKRVVSIRLPESLNTQLEIAAEKISTNKSDLIRTAIVAYFKLV